MKQSVTLVRGDCLDVMGGMGSETVDLFVTSPPYADARKKSYGGVHPDHYVEWFLPISEQIHRMLKPTGTFILNIKERVFNGARHTYVIDLIKAMISQGWIWTEEFCWAKTNSTPGKWPNRFRDGWERCIQFNKNKKFKMNQDAVMLPVGDWATSRLRNLSETDMVRDDSKVGSGFGKRVANWVGRDKVYPDNVLRMATCCKNEGHSAAFPRKLPEFFIKLFTDPGDVVCDPFVGSGTTVLVAHQLDRAAIGIDLMSEYISLVQDKINGLERTGESDDERSMRLTGHTSDCPWPDDECTCERTLPNGQGFVTKDGEWVHPDSFGGSHF